MGSAFSQGNPSVKIACCASSFLFTLTIYYMVPAIIDNQRFERNQLASCDIMGWDVKTRDCVLTVCRPNPNGGVGAVTCEDVKTICLSCRYEVAMTTLEGYELVATTDFDGQYKLEADIIRHCQARQAASPIPCWYQPLQPTQNRFYVSLTEPSRSTSLTPISVFGVGFLILCLVTCYSECKFAPEDSGLQRAYALARERAFYADMRAARWSEYEGTDIWEGSPASLTGRMPRREEGDGPRARAGAGVGPVRVLPPPPPPPPLPPPEAPPGIFASQNPMRGTAGWRSWDADAAGAGEAAPH